MPSVVAEHAIVIGAGMGGLAAAKSVAPYFNRVTVLDRDALPEGPDVRPGTPQARHAHALLAGGSRALEALFPASEAIFSKRALSRDGLALTSDTNSRVSIRSHSATSASTPSFSPGLCSSTSAGGGSGRSPTSSSAVDRVSPTSRHRLSGVRPSNVLYEDDDGKPQSLSADLVVDASGRAVPAMSLLDKLDPSALEVTEIGIDQAYATAMFEIPPSRSRAWIGLGHLGNPPEQNGGGLIFPIEHDRWIVSIGRLHGGQLPGDIEGFKAFVKAFRTPTFFDAIKDARQVGEIARYNMPASVRRRFDRIELFPNALIPLGDSVCRFNPIFGQGMSVAAQEAVVLNQLLELRCREAAPLDGLAQDYLVRIQDLLEAPWAVAQSDFVYPQTRGARPPDLEKRLQYGAALTRLAAEDPETHRIVIEVRHLIRPQSALREPALVRRVAALMEPVA